MSALPKKHLFQANDFYQMYNDGLLPDNKKLELLAGEIIDMAPIGSKHASCVSFLTQFLIRNIPTKVIVRTQDPIHLSSLSVPQPDIAIVKNQADYYKHKHPSTEDVLLLIEVAGSSLHFDRTVKMPLYAQHGIIETWLVDLEKNRLTTYNNPRTEGYALQRIYYPEENLAPTLLPDSVLTLANIF